jgi:hypothetical protein
VTRNNICTCLALYDWEGDLDTVQFHALAREFFDANGVLPDVCSVSNPAGTNQKRSYGVLAERLTSEPRLAPDGLIFYHTFPGYAQLIFGWDVTAGLSYSGGKLMDFCCDRTVQGVDLGYFERLLDRMSQLLTLRYGLGYFRSFDLGPDIYAAGMVTGIGYSKEEMAEADRIGAWFRERMAQNRHLSGYLRDVYPLNVISDKHLSQRVGGVRLADWIGRSSARGTLRQLPGGATLWRIDEANVEGVRNTLAPTGLLIAYPGESS